MGWRKVDFLLLPGRVSLHVVFPSAIWLACKRPETICRRSIVVDFIFIFFFFLSFWLLGKKGSFFSQTLHEHEEWKARWRIRERDLSFILHSFSFISLFVR